MKTLLSMIIICLPLMADSELRFISGATTIDVLDQGTLDVCPVIDCVAYTGSINGWLVSTQGSGSPMIVDLGSVDIPSSAQIDPLTLEFSIDNLIFNQPELVFVPDGFVESSLDTPMISFTFATGVGLFDEQHVIGFSFNTSPFSDPTLVSVPPGDNSITMRAVIDLGNGASGRGLFDAYARGDFDTTSAGTPEPVGIMLLGSGLLILGVVRWRWSAWMT